jgi:hypothetical protein
MGKSRQAATRSAAVALAASLFAVACGGQAGPTAIEVVAQSGLKAAAARTAAVTFTFASASSSGGQDQPSRGTGLVDFTTGLWTVDLQFETTIGSTTEQEIISGKVLFVKVPDDRVAVLRGKHWISLDLSTNATQSQNASDPSQAAKALQSVQSVSLVGHETLNGTAVTHYSATMNPSAQFPGMTGADAIPVDAWVDGQGRLRQEVTTIDYSKVTIGGVKLPAGAGIIKITMAYSDFGVHVNIEPPNPNDAIDVADAKKLLAG